MTGASIAFRNVGLTFQGLRGRVEAVRDFTLDVSPGEFVAILGPSGCGKSTLLNLLAGLSRPTSGEVQMDGKTIRGPGRERILVFQEGALFPWLDVQKNVEFGLRAAGIGRVERRKRAAEALALVQLDRFAQARPHELSGGMKQRVALARALVLEPQVLLMDEPFAALDAQTRDDLQLKVQELWMIKRPSVIFITHNVREAACLGDRIVVMTHRPGSVKSILDVKVKRPRSLEDDEVVEAARRAKSALDAELAWVRERELQRGGVG